MTQKSLTPLLTSDSLINAFKNVPYSTAIMDKHGYFGWANEGWSKMWQIPMEIIETQLYGKYNPLDDPQVVALGIAEYIKIGMSGKPVTIPAFYYNPNESGNPGDGRWIEITISPVKENDEVIFTIFTYLDLTDRINYQQELELNLRAQKFLANASNIFATHLDLNKAFQELIKNAREIICESCSLHILDPVLGEFKFESSNFEIKNDLTPFELAIQQNDNKCGNFIFNFSPEKQITDFDKMTFKSLADRITLALEARHLVHKLNESIEVRDTFISVASHELRTPLNTLNLATNYIKSHFDKLENDQEQLSIFNKMINTSCAQVKSMISLVDEMLDVNRMKSGSFSINSSEFYLHAKIENCIQLFILNSKYDTKKISFDCPKNLVVNWDEKRFEQILTNLFSNVIKYAPDSMIEIKVKLENDIVILSFCDDGPGIEGEQLDKIFDRFTRMTKHRSTSGLGVGLYIVKNIVESHFGTVSVASAKNEGACFILKIPKDFE